MTSRQAAAHILVVEDDIDIRESMVEILSDEGYSVTVAGDGREALTALRQAPQRPDLILLDLMMPNMDGVAFRAEQLKTAEYASIPVAVLTADSRVKEKAEQLQAAGYICKPLKIQPLLDLVERILRSAG